MSDIEQLEADLLAHWCECDDCGDDPADACSAARQIREQLRLANAIRVLRYQDRPARS